MNIAYVAEKVCSRNRWHRVALVTNGGVPFGSSLDRLAGPSSPPRAHLINYQTLEDAWLQWNILSVTFETLSWALRLYLCEYRPHLMQLDTRSWRLAQNLRW